MRFAPTFAALALLATPADTEAIAAHRRANEISADDVFTVCWTSGTEAEGRAKAAGKARQASPPSNNESSRGL